MKLTAPITVLCLLLAACDGEHPELNGDPLAPGAAGIITLGGAVDAGPFTTLEIRGFPVATDSTDADLFRQIPTDRGLVRAESLSVDGLGFPLELIIGADGIGATSLPHYRIVAWLAAGPDTAGPADGAPWGTAAVDLSACGFACEGACYCGLATTAAAVTLASRP